MQTVVLGCGPAGLMIANALTRQGNSVSLVGPSASDWTQNYGTWCDELKETGAVFAQIYPLASIQLDAASDIGIERPYGRLSNVETKAAWLEQFLDSGGQVRNELAEIVDADHGVVRTESGERIAAELIIDARGAVAAAKSLGDQALWQQGFGRVAAVRAGSLPDFVMMDFRTATPNAAPPSFLYAMRLGGGRYFFEETVLCTADRLSWDELRVRLERRLDELGLEVEFSGPTEKCLIPMNIERDLGTGRVVPFGAAAGFVHPATGYSLGFAASAARRVQQMPRLDVRAVREAIWPRSLRATDELFRLGGTVLASLGLDETRSFFGSFFGQSPELVQGYLSRTAAPADVRRLMVRTYRNAQPEIRKRLRRAAILRPARVVQSYLLNVQTIESAS